MAESSTGTMLKKGSAEVGELTSINGLDLTADTIEKTTLKDKWRKYGQGLKDAGEVAITGYFDKTQHAGLFADFKSGDEGAYKIIFPEELGAEWHFNAIVTAYSTGAEMEDNVSFEATLKVSGEPDLVIGAQS